MTIICLAAIIDCEFTLVCRDQIVASSIKSIALLGCWSLVNPDDQSTNQQCPSEGFFNASLASEVFGSLLNCAPEHNMSIKKN